MQTILKTYSVLTHWGLVMHIWITKLTIIGSNNGLLPGRHQAIIWTNGRILSIWTLATNCSEILSKIDTFSFKKIHLKILSPKWRQPCFGLNVLTTWNIEAKTKWLPSILLNSQYCWCWWPCDAKCQGFSMQPCYWSKYRRLFWFQHQKGQHTVKSLI